MPNYQENGRRPLPASAPLPGSIIILGSAAAFAVGLLLLLGFLFFWNQDRPPATPLANAGLTASPEVTITPLATATQAHIYTLTPPDNRTPTPSPTPTLAAPAEPAAAQHTVATGETLLQISLLYGVSVADIAAANNIADENLIVAGQVLVIPRPVLAGVTPTPAATTNSPATPAANQLLPANWPPSLISGDLAGNYPMTQVTASGALQLHYQPGAYPAANMTWLAPAIDTILAELQADLGYQLGQQVHVYLAGTLFAINPALQGYTQSGQYQSFILVNGAFHTGETKYILAHELAHIVATYAFGPPASVMLHEGLALYLPQKYLIEEAGYLPYEEICAAALATPDFKSAGQLSQLTYSPTGFGGHIRTFIHYNLSGCFVGYLAEMYGLDSLNQVYASGDYVGVYGRSLDDLDAEWQVHLATINVTVDPAAFASLVNEVALAYEGYVAASANGVHANWEAYLHLNQARLAANRGQLDQAGSELALFHSLCSIGC
ncbi:MAG: LysM peptidoglycan-binding domain-containing protein [Chloroflexi bacterium]|nr:LysM peptidoglycan-binding domain-containing protein [Chloroflexota bacterium]